MADIVIDGTIGANRLLILDSTGKIPAVDGSQITAIAAGSIATGTIPIARVDTGTTANKIVVLDGSGRLPAVSAALITNIPGATKSASDPVVATNPSGGVGTEWHNTTSGEVYICTDATAGANVWTNVGAGSGDITSWGRPWGGTAYGYRAGGYGQGNGWPNNNTDTIDKYSFTTDGNASDVGNLTARTDGNACHSSETYGYAATGDHPVTTTIWKWSFASDGNAVAYGGVLTGGGWASTGTYSKENGYTSGRNNSGPYLDAIDKFNYATEGNASDVGNLTVGRSYASSQSSATYGYCSGGSGAGRHDVIDRWSFSSDGNASDVGNLLAATNSIGNGQQSETYGYISGGQDTPGQYLNVIQKFPFANATTNSTDIADLVYGNLDGSGSSSTTHGYRAGGPAGGYTGSDWIQKFSTSSDANATDIGNLTENILYTAGCQY